MLIRIGLSNCASGLVRYPIVDEAAVADFNPELIFLSSEPYPFKAEHVQLLENQFPNTKVILVDGEYFSWYGSRLLDAPEYFKNLIDKVANA